MLLFILMIHPRKWTGLLALALAGWCPAQQASQTRTALWERAKQEFLDKQFAASEADFRELLKIDGANIYVHLYFGHVLFRQEKYAEAVVPYEKAKAMNRTAHKLTDQERHILTDQLVMAYGISGQLKKAHTLLDEAIQQDPEYPFNYFNLACAYAEEGNKEKMLANIALAFQHKDHVLKGEQLPDPREDSSLQKYARDSDFINLMKKLGFQ